MRDFRVTDVTGAVHPIEGPCPYCTAGYPMPCPRVTGSTIQSARYDGLGRADEPVGWMEQHCPGIVHAELGDTGALELRCAVCGVMP